MRAFCYAHWAILVSLLNLFVQKWWNCMRSLDILRSEDRLHREAILRDACVNGRYLMVHNVLAQAFSGDLTAVSNADLPEYLLGQLSKQSVCAPCLSNHPAALAA
jgi:hypothetical protein